jgi:hypothetical protein
VAVSRPTPLSVFYSTPTEQAAGRQPPQTPSRFERRSAIIKGIGYTLVNCAGSHLKGITMSILVQEHNSGGSLEPIRAIRRSFMALQSRVEALQESL